MPLWITKGVSFMDDFIKHHGVKGMRWGVRKDRYGQPTKKKRGYDKTTANYGKTKDILNSSSSIAREGGKTIDAIDGMRERSASKKVRKGLASMTDAELKAKVNRLNMEKQYSDLTSADRGRGSYYLGNMLDIVGSVTAIGASAVGIAVAIRQLKK